jgi:Family of unknown function (DUF5636)
MCDAAFNIVKDSVTRNRSHGAQEYHADYARIFTVLIDRPQIAKILTRLGNVMSFIAAAPPEVVWLRFSSVLSFYERKCWFPEDVLLPMGLLSSDDFYYYIRLGYVLKDYGAGVKHGEFTHRLQWHVIMYVATEGFTRAIARGWDHSPFDLYTSLGRPENRGLWVSLLDNRGEGGFSHPDSFHEWLSNSEGR